VVDYLVESGLIDFSKPEVKNQTGSNDLLYLSLSNKNLSLGSMLISTGQFDPNSRNTDGYTQLQLQAMLGNVESCKFLLSHGADIFAPGPLDRLNAIRLCETEFDTFEVKSRNEAGKSNPYEKCLNFLEDYAENIILNQK